MNEIIDKDENLENQETEEKIDINSELKGEKIENFDQIASLEFNNCVIVTGDGGDINTIFQNGYVHGDIAQGGNSQKNADQDQKKNGAFYSFYDKKEIIRFMEDYRKKEEYLSFVSVAFLECVPDFLWIDITRKLKEFLSDESEENYAEKGFMILDKELELMHMVSVPAKCRTRLGEVRTKCVIYFENKIREKVEKTIWEQDYFIRKKILAWLLALKNDEKIGAVMGFQIVNALSRISVYDWSFFQNDVFEPMFRERGNSNRNYLVKIMSYALKNSPYDALLDQSIQRWISEKNKFLWEISYRLYGANREYQFNKEVEKQLKKYFVQDINWRCLGNGVYRAKQNANIDFYPAYFNEKLRALMLKIFFNIYQECNTYSKKERFADYFIWLLTSDYKMEGYPNYKLIFLDALNQKETRCMVREMYWELWGIYKVRSVWIQILQNHFVELERHKKSWEYAKRFFEAVAFTGNVRDYETVQNCLYNMRFSKTMAREVGNYLEGIVKRRRG